MASTDQMLKKMRERMKGGKKFKRDPNEWRPEKASPGESLVYKFRVLPPLEKGDTCASGTASRTMDYWCNSVGTHWIDNRPHECPRVHDEEECPVCKLGFDLMKEEDDPKVRSAIAKKYLPQEKYVVNIYFDERDKTIPEELRGTVKWWAAPKSVLDIWEAAMMREDDGGDPDRPQAFGPFWLTGVEEFDNNQGGYTFMLEVERQGEWNSYKTSRFLANTLRPLAQDAEGNPDSEKIQDILDRRHDLYSKFRAREMDKLNEITARLKGEEPPSGFDSDDDDDDDDDVTTTKAALAKSKVAESADVVVDDDDDNEIDDLVADLRDKL